MKKLTIILTFIFLFILAGCSFKEKLAEKAGEDLAEQILEQGGVGEVDINGEKITIKGESGETVTFGGTDWPTSDLAKKIPQFKEGTVTGVTDSSEFVIISMEQVKKEDFESYQAIIKKDFNQESYESNSDGVSAYAGSNNEGIVVQLYYEQENQILNITIGQAME